MARKFELNDEQERKANEWLKEHATKCPYCGPGTALWMGTPIAYVFRVSGMGTEATIACNCGARCDISDPFD